MNVTRLHALPLSKDRYKIRLSAPFPLSQAPTQDQNRYDFSYKLPLITISGNSANRSQKNGNGGRSVRHLNESQRAMIAARLANMPQGARTDLSQICEKSQEQAATLLNVSPRSVWQAKSVMENAVPEAVALVDQGKMTVHAAAKLAGKAPGRFPTLQLHGIAGGRRAGKSPLAILRF
ncbi:MAG: hypothetical protein HY673_16705 [Chloroflexi bacterium]|nr:hypothetical protein [Chloroflexota bacterium]